MGSREQGFQQLQELAADKLISGFSDYSNARSLLTFLCLDCNQPFKTTGFLYNKSQDGKRCISCKKKLKVDSPDAKEVFIQQCKEKHGEYYDYSLLPETFTAKEKITIICPKHGEIETTGDQHRKKGAGCAHCKIDNITAATRSNKTEFEIKANKIHEFKYRYDKVEYSNATTPVEIICPKHGTFMQTPDVHLRGSGCSICTTISAPVIEILQALDNLGIEYSTEKTFPECKSSKGRALRFDVYVPEKNLCIEYDGIHHFQPTKYSNQLSDEQMNEYFVLQQENDTIKNNYCEQHNINFIRIPYTEYHPGAVVTKYIAELDDERFIYTWNDFKIDIRHMIDYIKTFNYSKFAVYGISRGGLPFAVPISNHFDDSCEFGVVRFQRYDGNDKKAVIEIAHQTKDIPIFIIDDLISSGETMKKVIKTLKHKNKKADIHPIVIFGDENEDGIFFIKEHPKQWIVFPYEI